MSRPWPPMPLCARARTPRTLPKALRTMRKRRRFGLSGCPHRRSSTRAVAIGATASDARTLPLKSTLARLRVRSRGRLGLPRPRFSDLLRDWTGGSSAPVTLQFAGLGLCLCVCVAPVVCFIMAVLFRGRELISDSLSALDGSSGSQCCFELPHSTFRAPAAKASRAPRRLPMTLQTGRGASTTELRR